MFLWHFWHKRIFQYINIKMLIHFDLGAMGCQGVGSGWSDSSWFFPATFGAMWQLVPTYGNFWQFVAMFGNFWQHVATFGYFCQFWQQVTTGGSMWQLLATCDNCWQLVASLAIFGICWQLLGSFSIFLWQFFGNCWQSFAFLGKLWIFEKLLQIGYFSLKSFEICINGIFYSYVQTYELTDGQTAQSSLFDL